MKRDFDEIIDNLRKSISSYGWYVNFEKTTKNVRSIEMHLNTLNYLIGKENFDEEFTSLYNEYPKVLSVIPILLAVRKKEVNVFDKEDICYNFSKPNLNVSDYLLFIEKTGLKQLFVQKKITNLVDYVLGIEVGMDTNARKNRTGDAMEEIVEDFIKKETNDYLEQANKNDAKIKLGSSLLDGFNRVDKEGNPKVFDFIVKTKKGSILVIETNFYSSGGSKLNETARSYKELNQDLSKLGNVNFVWITDGKGWKTAKNNLYDTYLNMTHLYTILDMENGILKELIENL